MLFLLDPAHDLQAMDRAFRFGQTRNVDVYRLLGAGSLEELIYARQLYKQQQMAIGYEASAQTRYMIYLLTNISELLGFTPCRYFKGIQDNNNQPGELFGLKNIFKLQEGELATKMAVCGFFPSNF
jgi:DNA excision repair protein ERCC-6-like 2